MTSVSHNLSYCYNRGCGKEFDINKNSSGKCEQRFTFELNIFFKLLFLIFVDACQYHPGEPVFHDALKGWSCCNKKSTDFTQFLSIPGCTKSAHTNVKPPEPEKKAPEKDDIQLAKDQVLVFENMKPPEPTPRPTNDAPLVELPRTVASSLTQALEKLNESMKTINLGKIY